MSSSLLVLQIPKEMDHYFVHIIQKDLVAVLMEIKIENNLGNLFIRTAVLSN